MSRAALAAALEARDRLLYALDHMDAAIQEQIADAVMGGLPDPVLALHLADVIRDRRNQLKSAIHALPADIPETAWSDAVKSRDAWRNGMNKAS